MTWVRGHKPKVESWVKEMKTFKTALLWFGGKGQGSLGHHLFLGGFSLALHLWWLFDEILCFNLTFCHSGRCHLCLCCYCNSTTGLYFCRNNLEACNTLGIINFPFSVAYLPTASRPCLTLNYTLNANQLAEEATFIFCVCVSSVKDQM